MNINKYWNLVVENEDELKRILRHKINLKAFNKIRTEEFEEVFTEAIIILGERINNGANYLNYDHIKNAIALIGSRYNRDKSEKGIRDNEAILGYTEKIIHDIDNYRIDTESSNYKTFEEKEAYEDLLFGLYDTIDNFVRENFSYLQHVLYKHYITNKYFEQDKENKLKKRNRKKYKTYSIKKMSIELGKSEYYLNKHILPVKKAVEEYLKSEGYF